MSPGLYRIVNSGNVLDQFLAVLARAESEGWGAEAARAFLQIFLALQIRPGIEGESIGVLKASKMVLRRTLERPLSVEYAVNEKDRVVYLRHIHLWPIRPTGGPTLPRPTP
jgi:hypothetical protein